jgi:2-polyprenyl-3-methyl-5-hydroxy-6-metoxy-1,4-benzoquinol methylase
VGRDEWDRHWAVYGEPAEGNPANTYRHRLVMKLMGRPAAGAHVLDIGSGQGELALLLKKEFPDATIVGIEYSAEGVQRAKAAADAAGLAAEFAQRDLLEDAPVDASMRGQAAFAVCSEVLEHVDDPELLLRNASEYLAPGCRIVVTVPGGPRSAFDRHIGHRQHFRPSTLRSLLEAAGFDVEYVARAGFPFFNLYRLAVIARGRRLIADLESGDGRGHGGTQGAVLAFFERAFRLNTQSSPFGWQMVAVGRFTGPRKAA